MEIHNSYLIAGRAIDIVVPDGVMPPSPYSILLAQSIPNLVGKTVADVGTGSGIQAIMAKLLGADRVYLLDVNPDSIATAVENAALNSVQGLVPLPPGDLLNPLSPDTRVDAIVCNPASLPMPQQDSQDSPYYAGPDGRRMIDNLIQDAPNRLSEGGIILMAHTSLANLPASKRLMESVGFEFRTITSQPLHFRKFYNRDWIDKLGGIAEGLYFVDEYGPYELVHIIIAKMQRNFARLSFQQGCHIGAKVVAGMGTA